MSIHEDLTTRMKEAMKAKDKQMLNLIRMLKSKMGEKTTAKGFTGEVNDALWIEVISHYAKSQSKALTQYQGIEGDIAAEHTAQIKWELEAVNIWLPKKADEETVRGWVADAVSGMGGPGAHFGAVMGAVMKAHKEEVDPAMVRRLVEAALS